MARHSISQRVLIFGIVPKSKRKNSKISEFFRRIIRYFIKYSKMSILLDTKKYIGIVKTKKEKLTNIIYGISLYLFGRIKVGDDS